MYGKPIEQENAVKGEKHFHPETQGIVPSATSHARHCEDAITLPQSG
jgi:hypothetical protein